MRNGWWQVLLTASYANGGVNKDFVSAMAYKPLRRALTAAVGGSAGLERWPLAAVATPQSHAASPTPQSHAATTD